VYLGNENHEFVKKGGFDLIFAQSVLEHVKNPVEVFATLYESLNVGGNMVISVPTPAASFWDDPTHVRPFTPKALRNLIDFVHGARIEINYVLFFLLRLRSSNQMFYRLFNWIPLSLGTNLIATVKKTQES
jgi:2-polyprenyl-3-methyl-5-hydroxy-6-metoxy-1,4-benzoquinol methylase